MDLPAGKVGDQMTRLDPVRSAHLALDWIEQHARALRPLITTHFTNLTHQANQHDSYPTQTTGARDTGTSTGRTIIVKDEQGNPDTIPVTTVESAVFRRHPTTNKIDDINAIHNELRNTTTPPPPPPATCDGRGLQGYELARSDGGWSDPTCERPADKAGLCSACYQRCRRFRLARGLKPLREQAA
jgi:hypothetical protein